MLGLESASLNILYHALTDIVFIVGFVKNA